MALEKIQANPSERSPLLLGANQTCGSNCIDDLDRDKLKAQLIRHEGKRSKVYKDSKGIPTIGVGFNLSRADAEDKIQSLGLDYEKILGGAQSLNDEQIDELLEGDIDIAIEDCESLFANFAELSDVRQRVLVDMTFNLGKTRLSGFKKMIAAVEEEDFDRAADEMEDSKWFKDVKNRGERLVKMMRTGNDDNK